MELAKKIRKILEHDAKISPKAIATMLDTDEDKVQEVLSYLEKEKFILGYNTVINWDRFGENGVEAMIDVKVTPAREVGFNAVAERISRFPEVRSVYLMSGAYDLSVVVAAESLKDIALFVSHKLSTLDEVQSTTTHFILKRYKQDNFIFEKPREDRRLVVSP
jgi:DNA-binding Lrp family transcriptional regulator